MSLRYSKEIYVPLEKDILLKNLYWTVNKFNEDPHHKQQNSSRDDLIGGFFDRWINRIPEFLIFDKFLKPLGYSSVVDNFIYAEKTSKNAPDIIGLKDNMNNYFPFAKFNYNRWEVDKDAPFIEMKVFRNSQNLITIPETQFKPWKYYAIVESYVPDDYLISVFENDFFENSMFFDEINDAQIRKNFSNDKSVFYSPKKLKKSSDLGGFKLLGIYKGSILEYYGKYIPPKDKPINNNDPISPIYLKKGPYPFFYEDSEKLNEGFFSDYYYQTCSIPIVITKYEDSEITIINSSESVITINVNGSVFINNVKYDDGDYKLCFTHFFRNCVKYYYLENVEPVGENLIVEKDLVLNSGLLLHYGKKQCFIDCSIEIDDSSSLYSVVTTKSYIIFKINGSIKINNEHYGSGLYKFIFISHLEEKTRDGLSYKMLQFDENKENIKRIKKYYRYLVSIPEGKYDFDVESLENPELDFSNFGFNVLDSSEIICKNSNNFIIATNGGIELESDVLTKGLYRLNIGSKNKKFFIKSYEEIGHPLDNSNAINLKDYLNYENNSYGIFDSGLIQDINIENSDTNDENKEINKNKKIFIPFSIKLGEDSTLELHEMNFSKMIISIDGSAEINNIPIKSNSNDIFSKDKKFYKIEFDTFKRTSKKCEFILSKKALESCNLSSELDLIKDIEKFVEKFDKT